MQYLLELTILTSLCVYGFGQSWNPQSRARSFEYDDSVEYEDEASNRKLDSDLSEEEKAVKILKNYMNQAAAKSRGMFNSHEEQVPVLNILGRNSQGQKAKHADSMSETNSYHDDSLPRYNSGRRNLDKVVFEKAQGKQQTNSKIAIDDEADNLQHRIQQSASALDPLSLFVPSQSGIDSHPSAIHLEEHPNNEETFSENMLKKGGEQRRLLSDILTGGIKTVKNLFGRGKKPENSEKQHSNEPQGSIEIDIPFLLKPPKLTPQGSGLTSWLPNILQGLNRAPSSGSPSTNPFDAFGPPEGSQQETSGWNVNFDNILNPRTMNPVLKLIMNQLLGSLNGLGLGNLLTPVSQNNNRKRMLPGSNEAMNYRRHSTAKVFDPLGVFSPVREFLKYIVPRDVSALNPVFAEFERQFIKSEDGVRFFIYDIIKETLQIAADVLFKVIHNVIQ